MRLKYWILENVVIDARVFDREIVCDKGSSQIPKHVPHDQTARVIGKPYGRSACEHD